MTNTHSQAIDSLVAKSGDSSLTLTSLMMVLGLKIDKLLEFLIIASANSDQIRKALEKQGLAPRKEEKSSSESLPKPKLVQKTGFAIMFGRKSKPEKPN